jgi:hypothetical protein
MAQDRDHHRHVDPLGKAEQDIRGVFDLAKRLKRAWDQWTAPFEPGQQPPTVRAQRRRDPSEKPAEQIRVNAEVVEDTATGIKIVVRDSTHPIKRGDR